MAIIAIITSAPDCNKYSVPSNPTVIHHFTLDRHKNFRYYLGMKEELLSFFDSFFCGGWFGDKRNEKPEN